MKKLFKFAAIISAWAVTALVGMFYTLIFQFRPRITRRHYKGLLLLFGN